MYTTIPWPVLLLSTDCRTAVWHTISTWVPMLWQALSLTCTRMRADAKLADPAVMQWTSVLQA